MRKFFAYICSALMFCGGAAANWGSYSAYDLYQMASSGNFRSLYDAVNSGANINTEDAGGKSAICYAIGNRDFVAYKNLVMVKADEHPDCVKYINKQDYEDFKRGYELRGGKISTPLFNVKGSTVAWTVAGVAAVGAGVAIAAGGGGGGGGGGSGSSSSSDTPSVTPTPTPSTACEGYTLSNCPDNSICQDCAVGDYNMYKRIGCKQGYKMNQSNTGCIVDTAVTEDYPLTECDVHGRCISTMSGDKRMYKLIGCIDGYKISSTGLSCEKICEGYTQTACKIKSEYLSATCHDDDSYHICTVRTNVDHCDGYVADKDLCTACYGNYKLNNGKCEQICKGYTQAPCNNSTQYTVACSDNAKYHKCITRTHTEGCSGYDTRSDSCTGCQGGYELKDDGACHLVCEGYTQDSCSDTQYIETQCAADKSYHTCADRTHIDGCMQKKLDKDECVTCFTGYKLNSETKACDPVCTEYTQQPCNNSTQYISETCADDNNFHKCKTRTVTEGCSEWKVNEDKCISCDSGYELDENGVCISACPGYTQDKCQTLEYMPEEGICANDPSFHLCKARKNTNACTDYELDKDWCKECEDGYKLVNHVCALKCPGYTNVECNYSKEWQSEVCSAHDKYHKCSVRFNLIGCAEFSHTSDTCTKCDGISEKPVGGICECKGYVTDECIKETQYISAECATAAGYHVCTERENTDGCLDYDLYKDKCTKCDKEVYFLPLVDGETSAVCTKREHTEGCKSYDEFQDKCTSCEKDDYFLPLTDDETSAVCTKREHKEGCKQYYEFSDTCTECDKSGYYLPSNPGICTPREHAEGCKVFDATKDKCTECEKSNYYLDKDDPDDFSGTCKPREHTDGCTGFAELTDTCTSCVKETHYLPDSKICTLREHSEGCKNFDEFKDECTACEKNEYYLKKANPEDTSGRCTKRDYAAGCTQFDELADKCTACEKNGYYLKKANATDTSGTCTLREHTTGCTNFDELYDKCTACEKNEYYLKKTNATDTSGTCTKREYATGCTNFDEFNDRCTACEKSEYYLKYDVVDGTTMSYGRCIKREHSKGCKVFTPNADTCEECDDKNTYYLPSDTKICTERTKTSGCTGYDITTDNCTSCEKSGYFLKKTSTTDTKGTCTLREYTTGCTNFDEFSDKCTACEKSGYYLKKTTTTDTSGLCTKREHAAGCTQFDEFSDKCTACEKSKYYLKKASSTDTNGTCTLRERTDGCKIFTTEADTCEECELSDYYLPTSGSNKNVCVLRTNKENCKTFSVNEDKCLTCNDDYKLDNGFCTAMCQGYQTEDCDTSNYYAVADCADESSVLDVSIRKYHRCVERDAIEGCESYSPSANTCKQCDSDHTLNGSGKCDKNAALCPGYTKSECNLETQYMPVDTIGEIPPICIYDATYHRCIARDVLGCKTYDPHYDKCASCYDGYNLVNGKCNKICPGYYQDACEEGYYISEKCSDDNTYHKCSVRTAIEHCITYNPEADKCTSCDYGYYVVNGVCEKLCPGYQKEECNNKLYYTGAKCAADNDYHKCEPRANLIHCTDFDPGADKCTQCIDGYKINNGSCEKICPGFTKEPCGTGLHQTDDVCTEPEGGDYHKCERDPDAAYIPYCVEFTEDKNRCLKCEDWYTLGGGGSSCNQCGSPVENCEKPFPGTCKCQTCVSGMKVEDGVCVEMSGGSSGGGGDTPSGGDDPGGGGGGGGGDTPSGDCTSNCSASYYKDSTNCQGDEGVCTRRKNYPIDECDTYAEFADNCEICENGYGVGDNTGSNTPNSNGKCLSQDESDCSSSSCPSGQHSYTEGCSSGHRCMADIENCHRYDSGDGLCDDCEDGYDLSSDRRSCTGSDSDCTSSSCPSGQHSYTDDCSSGHKCMADIAHCERYDSGDGLCDDCEDGYDLSSDRTSCTSSGSSSDQIIEDCDNHSMDWSKCTPIASCDGEKNYYESGSLHVCCTTKYSGSMTNPVYCSKRSNTYCGGSAGYHGYDIGSDSCVSCESGTPNNGRCPGDPQYVYPSSGYTVVPHMVTESKGKGMTVYTAIGNKLNNFGDKINKYNGYRSEIKQKMILEGEFKNAIDVTGSYNTHNGSEKTGSGAIEIISDEENSAPVKGAVKGLVGGNNYENSQVEIDVDVKDGVQNGKRSFIMGMGKEVGAYEDDKEEVSGIDMGSAEYGQHNDTLINSGNVSITSDFDAPVFGMLGLRHAGNVKSHSEKQNLGDFENTATGIIDIDSVNASEVYGVRINNLINRDGLGSERSNVINDGTINVSGGSNVYGIAAKNADIYNSGDININAEGDNVYGIYADTSNVENTGNINISAAKADNAYGIYAVNASVVKNSGIITINNKEYSSNNADGKFIYIDPTSYIINSKTIVSSEALNISDLGGGTVLMTDGSNITAPKVSGTLNLSSNVTTGSNGNIYVMQNLVNGSTQDLSVISQSAMFSAYVNDYGDHADAVLTRNSFGDLISDRSLAEYLEKNYAAGNGTELFDNLKNLETLAKLKNGIRDFFGQNMLPRMTFEDLSMIREINFDMNKNMFKQEGAFAFGGNVSPYSYDNNVGSVGRYALHGYNRGKNSYALGISISDVSTYDDNQSNSRSDRNFMMSAPLGHKAYGFEFITTPKIGYAYGEYTRSGFTGSYKGKVYKRMYALMNEARYPINFGKMNFTPSVEFNMIGFNVKGSEEAHKPYNLRVPSQHHYSVEAGAGFMTEKEFSLYKLHKFKFNAGLAFYHEFANPYELDISMRELDGTYRLHDEKRHSNRVAARFGFDYGLKEDIDVSMSLLSNIDGECRTDAVCDMKYHF